MCIIYTTHHRKCSVVTLMSKTPSSTADITTLGWKTPPLGVSTSDIIRMPYYCLDIINSYSKTGMTTA